jgi:hypothetical protein
MAKSSSAVKVSNQEEGLLSWTRLNLNLSRSISTVGNPPLAPSSMDVGDGSINMCAICMEPIDIRTTVQPCGHDFDSECIQSWVNSDQGASNTCPICRTTISELKVEAPSVEIIEPDLGINKTLDFRGPFLDITILEGSSLVTVRRGLSLHFSQNESVTSSRLRKTLTIKFRPRDTWFAEPSTVRFDMKAEQALEKAKLEVAAIASLFKISSCNMIVGRRVLEGQPVILNRGHRGINSETRQRWSYHSQPGSIRVSTTLFLEERVSAPETNPRVREVDIAEPQAAAIERMTANSRIQDAVQQVQGSLHWHFFGRWNAVRERFYRGSSNIFEPVTVPWCEACKKDERSGDCTLFWTLRSGMANPDTWTVEGLEDMGFERGI